MQALDDNDIVTRHFPLQNMLNHEAANCAGTGMSAETLAIVGHLTCDELGVHGHEDLKIFALDH